MTLSPQVTNAELSTLLQQADVWLASQGIKAEDTGVPTGFSALDSELSGSGWPQGALTEILCDQQGIGELQLLMPALAKMSQQGRWIAWIAPPHIPYAPALQMQGIDLKKILVVYPRAETDMLWTVEQALRSGTCGAVLVWPNSVDNKSLRRLQLAAEAGKSMGFLFRPHRYVMQSSPAALRLTLEMTQAGLAVNIIKRRGGWASGPLSVELRKVS